MVYEPHLKLTMSGTFIGSTLEPVEIFSMSLSYSVAGGAVLTTTQLQTMVDAAQTPIQTWFNSSGAAISDRCQLTLIKMASIGTNGKYTTDSAFVESTTRGGGADTPSHPSEVAYAVTLRTSVRGPKGRGRFYVPGPSFGVTSEWRIPGAAQTAAANAAATFVQNATAGSVADAIAGASPDAGEPYLLSVASKVAGNTEVNDVQVGDVLDVIRRRRNKLRENYVTGVFS